MANTRAETVALVILNTQRPDKQTLAESLCDAALKEAVLISVRKRQPFRDVITERIWPITTDATSVKVTGTGGADETGNNDKILNVITARIVDSNTDDCEKLVFKSKQWWDLNVIYAANNQQGWPTNGIRLGDYVYFDRPCEANKKLYLRCVTVPTYANDTTECPIESLDLFVERWVTANIFHSIEQLNAYTTWLGRAMIALQDAFDADIDIAQETKVEAPNTYSNKGLVIEDESGNIRTWF